MQGTIFSSSHVSRCLNPWALTTELELRQKYQQILECQDWLSLMHWPLHAWHQAHAIDEPEFVICRSVDVITCGNQQTNASKAGNMSTLLACGITFMNLLFQYDEWMSMHHVVCSADPLSFYSDIHHSPFHCLSHLIADTKLHKNRSINYAKKHEQINAWQSWLPNKWSQVTGQVKNRILSRPHQQCHSIFSGIVTSNFPLVTFELFNKHFYWPLFFFLS